jgi:predicted dinucleotide-utilizing enzyme
MKNLQERVEEATDVIGRAIVEHYGGTINGLDILSALATVAAEVILSAPEEMRETLLEAWDASPARLRAELQAFT